MPQEETGWPQPLYRLGATLQTCLAEPQAQLPRVQRRVVDDAIGT